MDVLNEGRRGTKGERGLRGECGETRMRERRCLITDEGKGEEGTSE